MTEAGKIYSLSKHRTFNFLDISGRKSWKTTRNRTQNAEAPKGTLQVPFPQGLLSLTEPLQKRRPVTLAKLLLQIPPAETAHRGSDKGEWLLRKRIERADHRIQGEA